MIIDYKLISGRVKERVLLIAETLAGVWRGCVVKGRSSGSRLRSLLTHRSSRWGILALLLFGLSGKLTQIVTSVDEYTPTLFLRLQGDNRQEVHATIIGTSQESYISVFPLRRLTSLTFSNSKSGKCFVEAYAADDVAAETVVTKTTSEPGVPGIVQTLNGSDLAHQIPSVSKQLGSLYSSEHYRSFLKRHNLREYLPTDLTSLLALRCALSLPRMSHTFTRRAFRLIATTDSPLPSALPSAIPSQRHALTLAFGKEMIANIKREPFQLSIQLPDAEDEHILQGYPDFSETFSRSVSVHGRRSFDISWNSTVAENDRDILLIVIGSLIAIAASATIESLRPSLDSSI